MDIKIVKLHKDSKIPTKGSEEAAGFDLYAYLGEGETVSIRPHETKLIGTGVAIQPPKGTFGGIYSRSGLASKQGLVVCQGTGVCDEDYVGEYKVALHNDSTQTAYVSHGDRIAQLIFTPYVTGNFVQVTKLDETERGSGGFGSTGSK